MSIPSVRLHRDLPGWLRDRTRVVLVQPSHPGNIGACARAMRVMGLRRLVLVDPVQADALRDPQALALSSGALDVLEQARVCPTLNDALSDVSLAVAISADMREFGPSPLDPDAGCAAIVAELRRAPSHEVALVFGPERTGLSIGDVGRCQLLCSIPGESDYNSLNLSQAVQVMAYELRRVALRHGQPLDASTETTVMHASQRDIEALYGHLERALIRIGFLDPAHPKKLMARLRRLFGRTRLETDEVQLLRGMCKLIESPHPHPQPPAQPRPSSRS